MDKTRLLMRAWYLAVPENTLNASHVAEAHADQLLDIAVAASPQSIRETLDELHHIEEQIMLLLSSLEERSKGFRNRVDYRQKSEAFSEFLTIIASEIKKYEARLEANKDNNGRHDISDFSGLT